MRYFVVILKTAADEEPERLRTPSTAESSIPQEVYVQVIKFGTDGWRGVIARDFTFANLDLVAQATMDHFRREGLAEKGLIIGYDRRFLSREFAEAVAEVAAGNGIQVRLADDFAPTPAISWAVHELRAGGGIMITASHNPPSDNAVKVYWSTGGQLLPPHDQGVIDHIGITVHAPTADVIRWMETGAFESVTIYYNAVQRDLEPVLTRAAELKIGGVAVVAYFEGDTIQSWSSKMVVVGRMKDTPTADNKGSNLLGIAYAKASEMADTLQNSGTAKLKKDVTVTIEVSA